MERREFITNTGRAIGGAILAKPMTGLMKGNKKRVALVGTGTRGITMFGKDLLTEYSEYVDLVGLCDTNPGRLRTAQAYIGCECPTFTDLDQMIKEVKPQTLIVTTRDDQHHKVIIRGMELGCDIMTEKPLTIDEKKAQAILNAQQKYGRNIIVTFNYRYPPYRAKIKELLMSGIVGEIKSVEFNYYLSHNHLQAYMQRWHGEQQYGGSLWVHKATHHFDLVNWYLDSEPVEVLAQASLERFGKNGTYRGSNCRNCAHTHKCPYYWDINQNQYLKALYVDNEKYDGYIRDKCVFRPEIDIYEKHYAMVTYANGASLSYILTGHSDYEGYYIAFDGTEGRLEARVGGYPTQEHIELSYIPDSKFTDRKPQIIKAEHKPGGHWGGDPIMMHKLFKDPHMADPLGQQAGLRDGIMSILIGIAARKSCKISKPVKITSLTSLKPRAKRTYIS